jgi:hypothetical protein
VVIAAFRAGFAPATLISDLFFMGTIVAHLPYSKLSDSCAQFRFLR